MNQLIFQINAARIFRLHVMIILALIGASLAGDIIHVSTGNAHSYGFRYLFHTRFEKNIPALFSSAALLFSSLMLLLLSHFYRKSAMDGHRFLVFLSIVFLYLSYDEAFSVHEKISPILRPWFRAYGILSFPWIVPGMLFAFAVFLTSIGFLRRINASTRNMLLLSGAVFIGGALGFEGISGWRSKTSSLNISLLDTTQPDLIYFLSSTMEEFLEMLGVALFLFTLIRHFEQTFGALTLRLEAS